MSKKRLLMGLALLVLLASSSLSQDEDKPSVWFLTFGGVTADVIQTGMLDVLETYGFIHTRDRSESRSQVPIESAENSPIQFTRLDADFEFDRLRSLVSSALDNDADVLVTVSVPITLAALNATLGMEDPPAVFFADVYNPYEAGIADAPCVKPAHVTGSVSVNIYTDIVPLLLLQNPDLKTVGTLYNSGDAAGMHGASQIVEVGESLGLTIIETAIVALSDLTVAAEGLVDRGVEAILLPVDRTIMAGMPIILNVANDAGLPVFHANHDSAFMGTIVSAGFYQFLKQGDQIGALVAAHLNGDLDISATSISELSGDTIVGVNVLAAEQQGISVPAALREAADYAFVLNNTGNPRMRFFGEAMSNEAIAIFEGEPEPLETREERDRAFLASLECTAERIAEQQAEFDAKS